MSLFKRKKMQEEPKKDVNYFNKVLVNCQNKAIKLNQLIASYQRNVNQTLNDLKKYPNNLPFAKKELVLWFAKKVSCQKKVTVLQTVKRRIIAKRDEIMITKGEPIFDDAFIKEMVDTLGDVGLTLDAEEEISFEQLAAMIEAELDNSMLESDEVVNLVEAAISSVLSTNEKTDATTTTSTVEAEKKEDESLDEMLERMKKHF